MFNIRNAAWSSRRLGATIGSLVLLLAPHAASGQESAPAAGAPVVPNSPAVLQQLQPSSPAVTGEGLPPAPLSPRISLRTDALPFEVGKGPKLGRFYLNRAEEDFSYLRDPKKHDDPFDFLKFIALNDSRSVYITFSGEERIRNELYTKNSFNFVPPKHQDTLLFRHMYGMDVHIGDHLRTFVQLDSGQEGGHNYGFAAGVFRNDLQVQQAFAEVSGTAGGVNAGLRVGRQELFLGAGTVFSTREPTNIPYSHDGFRAYVDTSTTRVDAFGFDTVINRSGVLQDSNNAHQQFWGFWGNQVLPIFKVAGADARIFVDPFYVGYDNRNGNTLGFVGHEQRQTFGGRLWGQVGSFDLDWTGDYQTGHVGRASASAFSVFTNTGYTFSTVPMQPRIGFRFEVASGGRDTGTNNIHTYNPLFAAVGALTEGNLLNYVNLIDTGLGVSFSPTTRLRVLTYTTFYWRYAQNDAVYAPTGNAFINTARVRGTALGYQPAIRAAYVLNDHVTLSAAAAVFKVDTALTSPVGNRNKNNFYQLSQIQFRF